MTRGTIVLTSVAPIRVSNAGKRGAHRPVPMRVSFLSPTKKTGALGQYLLTSYIHWPFELVMLGKHLSVLLGVGHLLCLEHGRTSCRC